MCWEHCSILHANKDIAEVHRLAGGSVEVYQRFLSQLCTCRDDKKVRDSLMQVLGGMYDGLPTTGKTTKTLLRKDSMDLDDDELLQVCKVEGSKRLRVRCKGVEFKVKV